MFFALFGQGDNTKERKEILSETGSLLDYVMDQSKALNARVGAGRSRAPLRLPRFHPRGGEPHAEARPPSKSAQMDLPNAPAGIPDQFADEVGALFDLIALAWQTNQTRVASMMIAKEISMRTYPNLQITEAFHPLSHHGNDPDKMSRLVQIQNYHTQLFAKFIDKLSKTEDGDGSLLDHSIILYGSNMSNSDLHNNDPAAQCHPWPRLRQDQGRPAPAFPAGQRRMRTSCSRS